MQNLQWDAHRANIERIYLTEGEPLKNLRQIMEATYGFRKT